MKITGDGGPHHTEEPQRETDVDVVVVFSSPLILANALGIPFLVSLSRFCHETQTNARMRPCVNGFWCQEWNGNSLIRTDAKFKA